MNVPVGRATSGEKRYARMFARLAGRNEGAFVPFTLLGDPDPATSEAVALTLARSGADALELGLPFSDPVADGPVIQAASRRALSAGVRVEDCWPIVAAVRGAVPDLPIGLLVYANLVLHGGAERFYARAASAGVDSVLVADVPLLESAPLERAAKRHGIAPVFIASPNVPEDRLREISEKSRGYVYVTSRPGVTGVERAGLREDAADVLRRLRRIDSTSGAPPPLLGFGIGSPGEVRRALELGAAGAISGSAIVSRLARHVAHGDGIEHREDSVQRLLDEIAAFVRSMKRATLDAGRRGQVLDGCDAM